MSKDWITQCMREARLTADISRLNDLASKLFSGAAHHEAIEVMLRALAIDTSVPELHYNLANIYGAAQIYDQALLGYQRAVELKLDYPDALSNWALVLVQLDRLEQAQVKLKKALRLDPFHYPSNLNLGTVLLRLGQVEEAEEYFVRARVLFQDGIG